MKNSLKGQGVLLALALLVSVCAIACGSGRSSGEKGDQQPATGEAAQTAKPGGIPKTSEAPKPGDVDTVDLGGGVRMELVWIPGRGANGGFWMGKYEVTNAQYQQFVKDSGYNGASNANSDYLNHFRGEDEQPTDSNCPVVWVSWKNAQAFCSWLSGKTGGKCGLPTVKQWTCACLAGKAEDEDYGFAGGEEQLREYAWYSANSNGQTHPVGQKKPNAFGLYDMHGNVSEWCDDEEPSGGLRALQGGGWYDFEQDCAASTASWYGPTNTDDKHGFRVIISGRTR